MPLRILVAEDEAMIAFMIQDILLDNGYVVAAVVGTISAAIEAIARLDLDGAILDVNLRSELVYPVADALIATHIPFVFSTGYDKFSIDPRFRDRPVLVKPFRIKTLLQTLQEGFRQHLG